MIQELQEKSRLSNEGSLEVEDGKSPIKNLPEADSVDCTVVRGRLGAKQQSEMSNGAVQ